MHDNRKITEGRIERFVRDSLIPALYIETIPLTLSVWDDLDEPLPFADAVGQSYRPIELPYTWGKAWSTSWFHVTGQVPAGVAARHRRRDAGRARDRPRLHARPSRLPGRGPRLPPGRNDGEVDQSAQQLRRRSAGRQRRHRSVRRGRGEPEHRRRLDLEGHAARREGHRRATSCSTCSSSATRHCWTSRCGSSRRTCGPSWGSWRSCPSSRPAGTASSARSSGWSTSSTPATCRRRPRPAAKLSHPPSPFPRRRAATTSSRSGTRTSTRRGCGPSARRSASAPGRSRAWWR